MPARSGLDIVDLGCGTGMMGAAVKSLAHSLTGIDCSPRMIASAGRRGIYDQLILGDIAAVLKTLPQADLVTATDLFIYVGDLRDVFVHIARILRADGGFAATVEKAAETPEGAEKPGYILRQSRRYAHSESYIRRLAAASMLDILSMESFVLRREGKTGIEGLAFVVGKKG
jgi:predicted TPR repeat methyltransferase